jgi:hypothetical protein
MSLWEFIACMDGLTEFHGGKRRADTEMSDERLAELGIEGF